ncbi:class I SAM-dependent methyltransferase [Bradyrhizobium brasilense]|uniref:class I SAM-dependent methyltransferase n=1 Tax=Bradyrhizobium brasilense TaxID=1419277 RepID=UPI0024B139F8|nr:class I SAM-dependent methyltransferase [Bradyrhizobium australafricanum]WFU35009.1 class I SAM-dependent methyltransferase [Bradyrhizobium australafricanum]
MTIESDARFWDQAARKYAARPIAAPAEYERTLDRTRALLKSGDRVLELGCGTGTTALRLAGDVESYLATDISAEMIAIANEKHAKTPIRGLTFRVATADTTAGPFDAILGFNYLHLVRDLHGTLCRIHALLVADGVFISKTPCVGEMNPLVRLVLPAMRAIGMAPHAGVFTSERLREFLNAGGFEIVAAENHATKGDDHRPYIVARKR